MILKTKTIAITAYKRPHYFERLILSLIKNDLQGWEIYIQLEPSQDEKYFFEIAERLLGPYPYFIGVNPSVLGVRDNPYHMLDKVFISGSLCCIYLEEDLIVSPDMTKIADWYLKQDHQGIIALNFILGGCYSAGFISHPNEACSFLKTRMINSLGLVFTDAQWNQHIKPNWYRNVDHAINHRGIPFDGWDLSLYDYLLSNSELFALQPICARVTHIGEEGATNTTKEFQELAFSGLSIYEGLPRLDYKICNDFCSLPYPLKAHRNLWQELTEALITLKKIKTAEAQSELYLKALEEIKQLKKQMKEINFFLEKIYNSKSWRLTSPFRWFNLRCSTIKNKLFAGPHTR